MMPFIFCAPWLMPMANTRNGTSTEYGSSSKPKVGNMPSNHTTAIKEQITTSKVLRTQRVYQYSTAVQMAIATAKNNRTCCNPSSKSPTILAKPVM